MIQTDKIGKIITFYSFKGGVGRSMALSNIACLLSKWGKSILIVDFDLEAPGIEKYFTKTAYSYQKDENEITIEKKDIDFVFNQNNKDNYGVVDILTSVSDNGMLPPWKDYLINVSSKKHNIKCDILPAGKDNISFASNLQNLNWDYLFTKRNFSEIIEQLRNEWKKSYDFVLIDSRTGISDIGGICTIYFPDILAFLFTTNEASLNGCIDVVQRAKASRNKIPYDRSSLITIPIPSRDESKAEFVSI